MASTAEMMYDSNRDMYFDNRQRKLEQDERAVYAKIQRQMMGNAGMGTVIGVGIANSQYATHSGNQIQAQTVQAAPVPPIRETKLLLLLKD